MAMLFPQPVKQLATFIGSQTGVIVDIFLAAGNVAKNLLLLRFYDADSERAKNPGKPAGNGKPTYELVLQPDGDFEDRSDFLGSDAYIAEKPLKEVLVENEREFTEGQLKPWELAYRNWSEQVG